MANRRIIQDELLHSSMRAHAPQHSMQQYTLLHAKAVSHHGTSAHGMGTAKIATNQPRLPPTPAQVATNALVCCFVLLNRYWGIITVLGLPRVNGP